MFIPMTLIGVAWYRRVISQNDEKCHHAIVSFKLHSMLFDNKLGKYINFGLQQYITYA